MMNDRSQTPSTNLAAYSVSELAFAIKSTIEAAYGLVRLRGEITGFRGRHSSGHSYFTLKDDKACIEAVVWKSAFPGLRFKPEQGLEVIATGRITTYPGNSKYQIVIEQLEPAGAGALMALLEERKRKLAAEGLFEEARKRPLPYLPHRIGVVTSPTGAVIRDILHRLADRFPCHVVVWPVRVQGDTCAAEVAGAIAGLNALAEAPDLIVVARGGGSLEDLWGFNEEIVVRAAAASAIPLISAVGHETDWTLLDLVADWRAPTPTAAAERAVPVRADLVLHVGRVGLQLRGSEQRLIALATTQLRAAARGLPRASALLALPRQRFDAASARLGKALQTATQRQAVAYQRCASRLQPPLLANRTRRGRDALTGVAQRGRRGVMLVVTARRRRIGTEAQRLGQGLVTNARTHRAEYRRVAASLRSRLVAITAEKARRDLATLDRRGRQSFARTADRSRARLGAQAKLLASLGYRNVLARGFSLVRDAAGETVRRADDAASVSEVTIEFHDGRVAARVEPNREKERAFRRKPARRAVATQESLF